MSYDFLHSSCNFRKILKGHQIIGELRLTNRCNHLCTWIERSPDHWWVTTCKTPCTYFDCNWKVTRSLVSYDWATNFLASHPNWKVTRSLVSYDNGVWAIRHGFILKGHQIIGELRLATTIARADNWNWKVTRSLVSYDWTTNFLASAPILKGHQIIGELRQSC